MGLLRLRDCCVHVGCTCTIFAGQRGQHATDPQGPGCSSEHPGLFVCTAVRAPRSVMRQRGGDSVAESRTEQWASELEHQSAAEILAWARTVRSARGVRHWFRRRGLRAHSPDCDRGAADSTCSRSIPACCSRRPTSCGSGSSAGTASPSAACGRRSRSTEQAARHGDALWEREPDRCCGIRKVAPLQPELAGVDAWITAIRRDQTPDRAHAAIVVREAGSGPREDQSARRLDD